MRVRASALSRRLKMASASASVLHRDDHSRRSAPGQPLMVSNVHHVGIVVKSLTDAYRFWVDMMGLSVVREAVIEDQGVRAALLAAGASSIELLEPTRPDTGIARFLDKRGEGLHHLCFLTPSIEGDLDRLRSKNVPLLDASPREGLAGRIAFLSPKACDGVLVELATPMRDDVLPETPVRFKRVVIGCRVPQEVSAIYHDLFGLPEVEVNGGPRAMLGWAGGATVLIVPAAEVGGMTGLVALSMVAPDMPPLIDRLERSGAAMLVGAGEITVEPRSSHGVHLHI